MSNQQYCIIPARALEIPDLKGTALRVLCYFGKHADKNGWWRLSQVKIARNLGCARSTVQESIDQLIEFELLEKHAVVSASGRTSAHYYRVIIHLGLPENGVPNEVRKTRDLDKDSTGENASPPAGTSGRGCPTHRAGPAASGPAPSITTHFNDPLSQDARAREREKSDLDLEKKNMKITEEAFWRVIKDWSGFAGMPKTKAMAAWKKLSDNERALAEERRDAWFALLKAQHKTHIPAPSTYFGEKLFNDVVVLQPVAMPTELKPFGKGWMAHRLELLKAARKPWMPTGWMAKMIAAGKGEALVSSRHQGEYPLVARMDSEAENGKSTWLRVGVAPPDCIAFVQIRQGDENWMAWEIWHAENDLPWITPPPRIEFVWVPAIVPGRQIEAGS